MREYDKEAVAAAVAAQTAGLRQTYETERTYISRIQETADMNPLDKWDALYEVAKPCMRTLAMVVSCRDPSSAELFFVRYAAHQRLSRNKRGKTDAYWTAWLSQASCEARGKHECHSPDLGNSYVCFCDETPAA